jgi:hypothetical protein
VVRRPYDSQTRAPVSSSKNRRIRITRAGPKGPESLTMNSLLRNAFLGQPPAEIPGLISFPPVTWRGSSGRSYQFQCHAIGTHFLPKSGVYVFCREASAGQWRALYIGEADNLDTRVGSTRHTHHKWERVIVAGATHICTLVVGGARSERLDIETDLRQSCVPHLNDQ